MTKNSSITSSPTASENATGWLGKLSLTFENKATANGLQKTVLVDREQIGPLTIQRPFYPEGAPCHLYLLHPPGGVVGGDRLELDVNLTDNTHLVMTMPGATKFYRTINQYASLKQSFNINKNSILEWLPQDNILFSGAKADIRTEIILHKDSQLLGWETLCLGRPTMNEKFNQGDLKSQLIIRIENSKGLNESLKIFDGNCAVIGGYAYSATFFAYPANQTLLELARETVSDCPFPIGITCIDQLLIARMLTNDNLECQHYLYQLWQALRPVLLNIPVCPPRIWTT